MRRLVLAFFLLLALSPAVWSCTGLVIRSDAEVLVGNNEDYGLSDVVVRARPARAGRYGVLLVGFGQQRFSMGGINEKGLVLDSFSVPATSSWSESPLKTPLPDFRLDDILERCANVDEAIQFCRRYNLPYFRTDHLLVADASGSSAVVEWDESDIAVVGGEGAFQVVTNFFLTHPERGWYPCWRHQQARDRLAATHERSWELVREILASVRQRWSGGETQYSNIYEVRARRMTLFLRDNGDELARFDLDAEIARPEHVLRMPELVSNVRLLAPADGATVPPSGLELRWSGAERSRYDVCLGTDPSGMGCQPAQSASDGTSTDAGRMALLTLAPLGLGLALRRRVAALVAVLLVGALAVACGEDAVATRRTVEFRHAPHELRPGTTYYWRVQARAASEFATETVVRRFTTTP